MRLLTFWEGQAGSGKYPFPRCWRLSPGARSRVLRVEAGWTRGQCAPRRPPVARAEAGHRPASVRPPEPRGYGVAASIGGPARVEKSPAYSSTVSRDLFGTDGDLRPADGVRGARGDGGARGSRLGNPPRLAHGARARVVSRPSFRARRPRRRASASRPRRHAKSRGSAGDVNAVAAAPTALTAPAPPGGTPTSTLRISPTTWTSSSSSARSKSSAPSRAAASSATCPPTAVADSASSSSSSSRRRRRPSRACTARTSTAARSRSSSPTRTPPPRPPPRTWAPSPTTSTSRASPELDRGGTQSLLPRLRRHRRVSSPARLRNHHRGRAHPIASLEQAASAVITANDRIPRGGSVPLVIRFAESHGRPARVQEREKLTGAPATATAKRQTAARTRYSSHRPR